MYGLPSLLKTAYYACNKFDLEALEVDIQNYCESLFDIIKIDKNQNEVNDRQTMFSRSKFPINHQRFKNICEKAALHEHIDCLRLAHEVGVPWGWDGGKVGDIAAKSGNLECLRYSSENGCPWDESAYIEAAFNSHMDCLVYALENGCPLDEFKCS